MLKTSIVLVHLGSSRPDYLKDCIHQLRLWHNPADTDIYLIGYEQVAAYYSACCDSHQVEFVATGSLVKSKHHVEFLRNYSNYDSEFRQGYWQFVVERFYFLEELVRQREIRSAVYIEYDVLVFQNLNQIQQQIESSIPHLALCFDNDWQGYPSFIIVNNVETLGHLNRYILKHCNSGLTDMKLMSSYSRHFPENLKSLPQLSKQKFERIPDRKTLLGHKPKSTPDYLYQLCERLDGHLFDAIALGQYLTGIDPRNKNGRYIVGYKNKSSFYTIDEIQPVWRQDQQQRWFLESRDGNRIANLHVHSKKLDHFLSDRKDQPKPDYSDGEIVNVDK